MENKGISGTIIGIVITIVIALIVLIFLWVFHKEMLGVVINLIERAIKGIKDMFGL